MSKTDAIVTALTAEAYKLGRQEPVDNHPS
jgi:hypothetical protein